VTGCLFAGNVANSEGSGNSVSGGALFASSEAFLNGCVFHSNSASGLSSSVDVFGGAVALQSGGSVNGSSFTNNGASGAGGGTVVGSFFGRIAHLWCFQSMAALCMSTTMR